MSYALPPGSDVVPLRYKLFRMAKLYDRSRVPHIDETIEKWRGHWELLVKGLEQHYGPCPPPENPMVRIWRMYRRYNPDKSLDEIRDAVRLFKDHEEDLICVLVHKYGPEPEPPTPRNIPADPTTLMKRHWYHLVRLSIHFSHSDAELYSKAFPVPNQLSFREAIGACLARHLGNVHPERVCVVSVKRPDLTVVADIDLDLADVVKHEIIPKIAQGEFDIPEIQQAYRTHLHGAANKMRAFLAAVEILPPESLTQYENSSAEDLSFHTIHPSKGPYKVCDAPTPRVPVELQIPVTLPSDILEQSKRLQGISQSLKTAMGAPIAGRFAWLPEPGTVRFVEEPLHVQLLNRSTATPPHYGRGGWSAPNLSVHNKP
eukprot:PhF_6_TR7324/c0_g1_i1/m.10983